MSNQEIKTIFYEIMSGVLEAIMRAKPKMPMDYVETKLASLKEVEDFFVKYGNSLNKNGKAHINSNS